MSPVDITNQLNHRLAAVRLLAMDIDGVLTDGRIHFDSSGTSQVSFHVADGLGLVVIMQCGVEVAWITGRSGYAVEKRAQELGIKHLFQSVRDKGSVLLQLGVKLNILPGEIAFVGDDWNDLPAFDVSSVKIAVANAHEEVKSVADMLTIRIGGDGAVREVVDRILAAKGLSEVAKIKYLNSLKHEALHSRSGQ